MVWRNKLKMVREKTGGLRGIVRSSCHGLTYPPREGMARGIASFHVSTRPMGTPSSDKCIRHGRVTIFGERGIGLNTFGRI